MDERILGRLLFSVTLHIQQEISKNQQLLSKSRTALRKVNLNAAKWQPVFPPLLREKMLTLPALFIFQQYSHTHTTTHTARLAITRGAWSQAHAHIINAISYLTKAMVPSQWKIHQMLIAVFTDINAHTYVCHLYVPNSSAWLSCLIPSFIRDVNRDMLIGLDRREC